MRALFLVILALALLSQAGATHPCTPTTSSTFVDAGGWYVTFLCSQLWCPPPDVTVYQEANGIPGLQRSDEVIDDTCRGTIQPDTLIFPD